MKKIRTEISICTTWEEDPAVRHVEVAIKSSQPLIQQKGISSWLSAACPELPCFFQEVVNDYYMSEDGRRMLVICEDREVEACDDRSGD